MSTRRRTPGNDESRIARGNDSRRGNGLRRGAPQAEHLRVRNNVGRDAGPLPLSSRSASDRPTGRDLIHYPIDMLRRFRHDMDRFFEDMSSMRIGDRQSIWSPRTEVFGREGRMVVRMELPGLEKNDVKVLVSNDRLVIEGERRHDEQQQGRGYFESEWSYGRFYREIPLPEAVEASEVKASFSNGVLEIDLPQPEDARERREVPIR